MVASLLLATSQLSSSSLACSLVLLLLLLESKVLYHESKLLVQHMAQFVSLHRIGGATYIFIKLLVLLLGCLERLGFSSLTARHLVCDLRC